MLAMCSARLQICNLFHLFNQYYFVAVLLEQCLRQIVSVGKCCASPGWSWVPYIFHLCVEVFDRNESE